MEVEYNMYANLLKDAIIAISLSPREQVALAPSGCLACHLLKDVFFTYRDFKKYNHEQVSAKELNALDDIIKFMHNMEVEKDHRCFENQSIETANWQELRRLAKVTRLYFNW